MKRRLKIRPGDIAGDSGSSTTVGYFMNQWTFWEV